MSQENVYREAGFGRPVPRGTRPAVLVVDFIYSFTDKAYPTAAEISTQLVRTREISDLVRSKGFPVIYTTIAYHPGELDKLAWLKKAAGMAALVEGTRLVEVDAATGIQPKDAIVIKKGASAFFGTSLAGLLSGAGVDTLIVTGATTSGCVRASVVDAVQSGFHTLVPHDCCADRAQAPHDANLYDMGQKYADVVDSSDVLAWLGDLPGSQPDG